MKPIKSFRLHYNPAFSSDSIVLKAGERSSLLSEGRVDKYLYWEKDGVVYGKAEVWIRKETNKECVVAETITVKYGVNCQKSNINENFLQVSYPHLIK